MWHRENRVKNKNIVSLNANVVGAIAESENLDRNLCISWVDAAKLVKDMPIVVIGGKSCSGKDTFAKWLSRETGKEILVTSTTRPMRSDDVNGVSHWFIDEEEFEKGEWGAIREFAGYKFGCPKGEGIAVLDLGGYEQFGGYGLWVACTEKSRRSRAEARGALAEWEKRETETWRFGERWVCGE